MTYEIKELDESVTMKQMIKDNCSFVGAKCTFIKGNIISINKTNLSFIDFHKVIVEFNDIKLLLLYYRDELFLFDRTTKITVSEIRKIIRSIKKSL